MRKQEIVKIIKQEKIIAIIRLNEQDKVAPLIKSLVKGGVKVLEITSNTPGFSSEILQARNLYSNVLIGAGTVMNERIATKAISAGAQFLVTPNVNIKVIAIAHKNGIPVLMGAVTPTEICTAVEHGADFIKLFPAGNLGIDYFKSIRSVMNSIEFFAVGGIDFSNAVEWMNAGMSGVGLGSALTKGGVGENEKMSIENTVEKYIQLLK